MKRLHLGAGPKVLDGYINCDCRDLPGINKVFDLEKDFPYPFEDDSIGHIHSEETLEHLSWRSQNRIFEQFQRILFKGGSVSLQVPDVGKMCENYVNKEICDCVPHKSETLEGFKAKPDCIKCGGKAKVNPTRWLMAYCGAQKHPWDTHKTMFTKEYMTELLTKHGFGDIKYEDHPYKIKVTAKKI